ncbi:hypothetical protein BB561_004666 [Smittium simulii]|uniref:Uncharacterized protein n=1 Tax=Smittium simulii TaxID=133385 RepID=A0A2T9YF19_9FUNG|nr:hypothetical protein BB561_004666 [Smittium simulii]
MQQDMQEKNFKVLNDLTEKRTTGRTASPGYEVQIIECDDSHEKIRASMVEVESYPRLIEAITLLETDFFRRPIPEEEKKKIIYESTPDVRKNDATLYGIQMALPSMTRPIDDYVHINLKDPATRIRGKKDLEFAQLMRELLSDLRSHQQEAKNRRCRFCQRQQTKFGTTSTMTQTPQNITSNTGNNSQTKTTLRVLRRLNKTPLQQINQGHSKESFRIIFKNLSSVKESLDNEHSLRRLQGRRLLYICIVTSKDKNRIQLYNNQDICNSHSKKSNQTCKEYDNRFLQQTLYHTKKDRQSYNPSIRAEIWGNYLSQITRSLRKTVVSLYRDKHTPSDVLCTNVHQPGRRAIKTNSSNGMVSINRDIQKTEQDIWPIRRGSVCNKTEQEAVQILQLVPGQSISRNQRTESLLVAMEQPLLLSPVESNTTDPTEGSTGKDNYDNNYANVEVCDLVSNSEKIRIAEPIKIQALEIIPDQKAANILYL